MERRTLAQHKKVLLGGVRRIDSIEVLIADAAGAMLADDLIPENPLPPVTIATCDGYALLASDVASATREAPVTLAVSHDVTWLSRAPRRHIAGTAARIASGAPVPAGADAVIPAGATNLGVAKVDIFAAPRPGANLLPEGSDAPAGKVLVKAGTRLGAQQLGLAAMLGRRRLTVYPTPRVVILAVGNELTEPGVSAKRGGVPESNSHTLSVMVQEAGANAYRVGLVADDRISLRTTIEDQLVRADLILTTGSLSGGRDDSLPDVLAELGEFEVASVALMPGRLHGFGAISAGTRAEPTPVVALPGHPAAAITAFEMYVRPMLRTMSGYAEVERRRVNAASTVAIESPEGVTQCIPMRMAGPRESLTCTPIGDTWQPALADMAQANALAVLAEDVTHIKPGDLVPCLVWTD